MTRNRPIWEPSRILSLRKRLGLSATEFASELGLAGKHRKITISRFENGKKIPSDQLVYAMEKLEEKLVELID